MSDEAMLPGADERACAFCGTPIHGASHRCSHCGGHVGIAWKTVHAEQFLFLFASLLVAVGCLASWNPHAVPESAGGPARALNGLDTIRGALLFAVSLYGVVTALLNITQRRLVVWPFLLSSALSLWIGLEGLSRGLASQTAKDFKAYYERKGGSMIDTQVGFLRAVPPGMWLLVLAGALVALALLKGVLAGASSAGAKQRMAEESKAEAAAARRARREGKPGGEDIPPTAV